MKKFRDKHKKKRFKEGVSPLFIVQQGSEKKNKNFFEKVGKNS